MSRVTRESFVQDMSSGKGLDVNALSPEAQAALKKAGIDQATLKNIAGTDGVIRGKNELDALFTLIDTKDRDGNYHSIKTTKRDEHGKEVVTVSGQLMDALTKERERARLGGPAAPPAPPKPAPTSGAGSRPAPDAREPLGNPQSRPKPGQYEKGITTLQQKGFTDIHIARNTPYFNQYDEPWGSKAYPKVGAKPDPADRSIAEAGCAPSALAIADATLRGSGTTPETTAKFAVDRKFSGNPKGFGSDTHPLAKAWAKEHGLSYTPATSKNQKENVDTIRDGLKNGGVAIIGVGDEVGKDRGHFTAEAHVMVINGYAKDKDGKEWFFVVDPGRRNQEKSKGGTDTTVVQEKGLHHGAGQLRISREQLEKELKHGMLLNNKRVET